MDKKTVLFLVGLIALSVSIGIACLKFLPDFGVKEDALAYDKIGLSLAQGNGFSQENTPSAEVPGYPFFLSLVYFILGHNFTYVKTIQFVILGLISFLVFILSRNILKIRPIFSFFASLFIIFWPYFLLYSNLILSEVIFTLFLLMAVFLILQFQKSPSYKTAAILGIWLGVCSLLRVVALFLPFFIFIAFIIFFKEFRKKENIFKLSLMAILFLASLAPWTIRNYLVFDKFIPIHPRVGQGIEKSYVQLDYFSYDPNKEKPAQEASIKKIAIAKLKNIYFFWNPGASGWQIETLKQKYPKTGYLIAAYKIIFFLILALAALAIRHLKNKNIFVLFIIIAYFWGLHTALYPYPRYTLPIIPLVISLCFFSINQLFPKKEKA